MDKLIGIDISKRVVLLNIVQGKVVGEEPYISNGREVYLGEDNFLYEVERPNDSWQREVFLIMHGKPYKELNRLTRDGNPILFHPTLNEIAEVKEFAPGYFYKVGDFLGN